jgi:hypothetical protein
MHTAQSGTYPDLVTYALLGMMGSEFPLAPAQDAKFTVLTAQSRNWDVGEVLGLTSGLGAITRAAGPTITIFGIFSQEDVRKVLGPVVQFTLEHTAGGQARVDCMPDGFCGPPF